MSDLSNFNLDVDQFFRDIENQTDVDKKTTLKLLLTKYIHTNECKYLMNIDDVRSIISHAKVIYSNETFPIFLGEKRIRLPESDQANLCLIQSTVNHFNTKNCFNKLPIFDKREDKI